MSEHEPASDLDMYVGYENARQSLVVAFDWAMGQPDTAEYGNWSDLDKDTQELVVAELVDEIYSYGCGELELPTELVDDCFSEATVE